MSVFIHSQRKKTQKKEQQHHIIFFILNRIRRMQFDRIIPAVKIILNPNISVDAIILISNI